MKSRLVHISNDNYFGGIPEIIRGEIKAFARMGIAQTWLTLGLDTEARNLGKHLLDLLHGTPPRLSLPEEAVRSGLAAFGCKDAERLKSELVPSDIVMLHDPLAMTLAPSLKNAVGRVIWRSHIGPEMFNENVARGAQYLEPFMDALDAIVFYRPSYIWPHVTSDPRVLVSPPGIDPDSPKNIPLDSAVLEQILPGLLTAGLADPVSMSSFAAGVDPNTVPSVLDDHGTGWLPASDVPFLFQAARWDRQKGHEGLLRSFVEHLATPLREHHLVFVGPRCVSGFSDPDNLTLLDRLLRLRDAAPPNIRSRIHLWSFAISDPQMEGLCINMLQRAAHTVLQKSIQEGFGLAVTEAMWKRKVVVASAVGGLRDQITRGVNGILSDDVEGTAAWSADVVWACTATDSRPRWAQAAHASSRTFLAEASAKRLQPVLL